MARINIPLSIWMFLGLIQTGFCEPKSADKLGAHGCGRGNFECSRAAAATKYGGGRGSKGKQENRHGMKKMKELMKRHRATTRGFPDTVEKAVEQCKRGDFGCLKRVVASQNISKLQKAKFVREGKGKQRRDIIKSGFKANGNVNESEICPDCMNMDGRKRRFCFAKCKKEAVADLMQEKTMDCIAGEKVADCMCTMDDETWNISKKMKYNRVERTVRDGLKNAVCSMFKVCIDSGDGTIADCKSAAQQVIDDASCVKEHKQHVLKRCMMNELKAMEECNDTEAGDCFKESLKSLVKRGVKKRQVKKMFAAQALKEAYESFADCSCTNEPVQAADCHEHAKKAFNAIRRIRNDTQLAKQYDKIQHKVEKLAAVVCGDGEIMIKLKDVLAVELSTGNDVCSDIPNISDVTDKVANEGIGALMGNLDCAVEFGKAYVKANYNASGKTTEQINVVADKLVDHFGTGRRLTNTYDELYADQDSEEFGADDFEEVGAEVSTQSPMQSAGNQEVRSEISPGASSSGDVANTDIPIVVTILAMMWGGRVMSTI